MTWFVLFPAVAILFGAIQAVRNPHALVAARRSLLSDEPLRFDDARLVHVLVGIGMCMGGWLWYSTEARGWGLVFSASLLVVSACVELLRRCHGRWLIEKYPMVRFQGLIACGMAFGARQVDRSGVIAILLAAVGAFFLAFPRLGSHALIGHRSVEREVRDTRFTAWGILLVLVLIAALALGQWSFSALPAGIP